MLILISWLTDILVCESSSSEDFTNVVSLALSKHQLTFCMNMIWPWLSAVHLNFPFLCVALLGDVISVANLPTWEGNEFFRKLVQESQLWKDKKRKNLGRQKNKPQECIQIASYREMVAHCSPISWTENIGLNNRMPTRHWPHTTPVGQDSSF